MSLTLEYTGELTVITCWCGMAHAVPTELRDFQLRQHRNGENVTSIYCPLGHQHQPAGRGEAAIEREKREKAERDAANAREDARILRAELTAAKSAATKARNRAKGGACPCCNRTFVQLSRHIAAKHPEFAK